MADQSDIESVLASEITETLYPQGINAPSVIGRLCRIFRGWPNSAALDNDLAAGHATITIYPGQDFRLTTRHIDIPVPQALATPSLTATASGSNVTYAGTADEGQVAGILIDNQAFVHRTAKGDTPALVAAILAGYIRTKRIATVSGATITVPGAMPIPRVVADQGVITTTRRQAQDFTVSIWCPDPATRDSLTALIDAKLSASPFIALPDDTHARLRFRRSRTFDQSQNANLYRRDLVFEAEYATTLTTTLPALIFGDTSITPNSGPTTQSLLG